MSDETEREPTPLPAGEVAVRSFSATQVGVGAAVALIALGFTAGFGLGYLERTYARKDHVAALVKDAEAKHAAQDAVAVELRVDAAEIKAEARATRREVERVFRQVDEIAKVTGARRVMKEKE